MKGSLINLQKKILNPISKFLIGLLLGIISRLLDIYTQNLGIFFPKWPFGFY